MRSAPLVLVLVLLTTPFTASLAAKTIQTADGPVRVNDWGYQLQGQQAGPLGEAPHDLLVTDFSRFGTEATKFTPGEVAAMQDSVGGDGQRKVVTSYLSIGEASDFRTYWDDAWTANGDADSPLQPGAPTWLGPVNPSFPESRKVRYWDTDWQDVVFNNGRTGWLDQIVTQGFDGAYLDIVDAFYFWGNEVEAADQLPGDPIDGQDAARRMAEFVVEMTAHAREANPSFFVIPQNGAYLLNDLQFGDDSQPTDDALRAGYLDAIGIEDLYYQGDDDENNPLNIDNGKVSVLKDDFLAAGKPVFVVDYLNDPAKVADFQNRAREDGFIPYASSSRGLDSLDDPAPTLAGDFDGNGLVDAADYDLWEATHGSPTSRVIDAADYTVWRDASATPALVVPEPTGVALLAGVGLALAWRSVR